MTQALAETGRRTATIPAKPERIAALDFTKGALVLIMVLYHWINYFVGGDWPYYRYLRFLTPSFIFISGFMVSNIYLSKYKAVDWRLSRRLIVRGVKLLAVFLALNAARVLVLPNLSSGMSDGQPLTAGNLIEAFVTGNFTTKVVSFSILVPIGYLLILSGILMPLFRHYRLTFHVVFFVFLTAALALNLLGHGIMNLEILTMGMLGLVTGFMPMTAINRKVGHPCLLAFLYLLYVVAITIWNVLFPLVILGVCLSVMAIYLIGISGDPNSRARQIIDLLGRYSLFGYIAQIAILQILAASLRRFDQGLLLLLVSFVAAFALTIISTAILDRTRRAATAVDKLYRVVFN